MKHQAINSNKTKGTNIMSRDMKFSTMSCVQPAKPQISLRIQAVWSELLLVALIFYEWYSTYWISFEVSKHYRRLHRIVWVYTCQTATLVEIKCHDSYVVKCVSTSAVITASVKPGIEIVHGILFEHTLWPGDYDLYFMLQWLCHNCVKCISL